jgi:hypothetical protein
MEFLYSLDVLVQKFVAVCVKFFSVVFFSLLAVLNIVMLFTGFFEYGEGLAELDTVELFGCMLFVALSWRFFRRGRNAGCTRWPLLLRYCRIMAFNFLLISSVYAIVFTSLLYERGSITVAYLTSFDDQSLLLEMFIVLLLLYCLAPIPSLKTVVTKAEQENGLFEPDNVVTTTNEIPIQTHVDIQTQGGAV